MEVYVYGFFLDDRLQLIIMFCCFVDHKSLDDGFFAEVAHLFLEDRKQLVYLHR